MKDPIITIRYCRKCHERIRGRHLTLCHTCAAEAQRVEPTEEEVLAQAASFRKPLGGVYCPDDASEKAYRESISKTESEHHD